MSEKYYSEKQASLQTINIKEIKLLFLNNRKINPYKMSIQCLMNRAVVCPSIRAWTQCQNSCTAVWDLCDRSKCYRSHCHSLWGESISPSHHSRWRTTASYCFLFCKHTNIFQPSVISRKDTMQYSFQSTVSNPLTSSSAYCSFYHYCK